jgi:hypothetical protein
VPVVVCTDGCGLLGCIASDIRQHIPLRLNVKSYDYELAKTGGIFILMKERCSIRTRDLREDMSPVDRWSHYFVPSHCRSGLFWGLRENAMSPKHSIVISFLRLSDVKDRSAQLGPSAINSGPARTNVRCTGHMQYVAASFTWIEGSK